MRSKQTCTKREKSDDERHLSEKCKQQGFLLCVCEIMLVFIRLLIITAVWLVTKLETS